MSRQFDSYAPDKTGLTDVTALLGTAMADVVSDGGGYLIVSAGVYLIGSSVVPSGVVVLGEHDAATRFVRNPATALTASLFQNSNLSQSSRIDECLGIENVFLDGNGAAFPAYPDPASQQLTPLVRFSTVDVPTFKGCRVEGWANTAVQFDGCRDGVIAGNVLRGTGTPWWISPGIRVQASGQRFRIVSVSRTNPAVVTIDAAVPSSWAGATIAISGCGRSGMTQLSDGNYTGGTVSGSTITLVGVDATAFSPFIYTAAAVIRSQGSLDDVGCMVRDNKVRDGERIGIEAGGDGMTVDGNVVDNMREGGIYVNRASNAKFIGNTVRNIQMVDITAAGYELASVKDITIAHGDVENVEGAALMFHTGKGVLFDAMSVRNPFCNPARTYAENWGSVGAGLAPTTPPTLMGATHRGAVMTSDNAEPNDGLTVSNSRFIRDIDDDGSHRMISLFGSVASGGSRGTKNIMFVGNDVTGWTRRRAVLVDTVATAPVEGELLTAAGGATFTCVYYYGTAPDRVVYLEPVNGLRTAIGEAFTGAAGASFTATSWDFDANLLVPNGNVVGTSIVAKNNAGHASQGPVREFYSVPSGATGTLNLAFGFCPSRISFDIFAATLVSTNLRTCRTDVICPRTSDTDKNGTQLTRIMDGIGSTISGRIASTNNIGNVVKLIDAANNTLFTATLAGWKSWGVALNLTTTTIGVNLAIEAIP